MSKTGLRTNLSVVARLKEKILPQMTREDFEHCYAREGAGIPLREPLKSIQDQFAAISCPGGMPADKALFDDLSGKP
jgi:hypothetical protein